MSTGPIPIPNPEAAEPGRLLTTGSYSPNPMTSFARWLGETGSHIRAVFTHCRSSNHSLLEQLKLHEIRNRAIRLKDEHPVSLLGAMAGTAFALGIGARLLRSRRS